MDNQLKNHLYTALKLKYQAQYKEAEATMYIYFNQSVGIGEHPQHVEEMDKLVSAMVDANDKLELLTKSFSHYELQVSQSNNI
jgi:hypothetical protein